MFTAARLLAAVALATSAATAVAGRPPVEAFFRNVEFDEVKLSPDGRFLAAIARIEAAPDARNLVVLDIDAMKSKVLTGYDDEDIRSFEWVSDERLLFTLDRDYDSTVEANSYSGTYAINRDGGKGAVLHQPSRSMRAENVQPMDVLRDDEEHVLVEQYQGRLLFPHASFMNVRTGHMVKAAFNERNVLEWHADKLGVVRAGVDAGEERDDLSDQIIYRESDDAQWRPVLDFHRGEVQIYGFDVDDRHIWLAARIHRDTYALYKFDPETGGLGKPVFADPDYDISSAYSSAAGLVFDDDGTPLYLQYIAEKPKTLYFHEEWASRQATLDAALPATVNTIVGWDRKQGRFLIRSTSDRVPGDYYLYDEGAAKIRFLLSTASWIDSEQMAEMRPIHFEARDGLKLHGYLTLPRDFEDEPVPLVVHPHGGPYGIRDEWGYDREVQFLASLGYGVLQINYRGSGGYGERFERVGYKRWGLEMQDDITDGVRWAIEEGFADARRICIYGASYGGYATMVGLTKTPELYRCGINYVGVVDLPMLYRQATTGYKIAGLRGGRQSTMRMILGNPRDDGKRFYETSPINFVEDIRAPLFVIHGRLDYNVDIHQYQALVRQLNKHDKEFETMTERYQGHGFRAERANIDLHERIEEFLAENL